MVLKTAVVASLVATAVVAYDGSATFYGAGGAGEQGTCGLAHGFNGIPNTVAVGPEHFRNGRACGLCLQAYFDGEGYGVKKPPGLLIATIDNLCSECTGATST